MKRLILTLWILLMVLSPVSVDAAENQSIIFTGSYSLNNVGTDADSAWLYLAYYDTDIDSVLVPVQSEGWNGYYRYKHACTNDSIQGWSGHWVFVDNSVGVRITETATVATARDSSYALEASVTAVRDSMDEAAQVADTAGLPESVYAEFTDGTNEDAFKYGGVTGEYQLTIVAYDSSSNVVLMDCPITIRNEAQNSQRWEYSTLSTGVVVFPLDSGSYTAYGSGTREISEIDTILVDDDMLDTVFFWTRIVEVSGDPDLCTVFGSIMSPKGEALQGVTLTFSLPGVSSDTAVGKMLSTEVVTTWTDASGDFSVDLLKTENLIPAGKRWHLSVWHEDYFEYMRWTADFPVPADSNQLDISGLTADMIGHSVR